MVGHVPCRACDPGPSRAYIVLPQFEKPKGQSRMDNSETQATTGAQDTERGGKQNKQAENYADE